MTESFVTTEEAGPILRRVNDRISTRGQRTWDTTVDGVGYSREEILAESDAMVRAMEARYPAAEATS